MSGLSAAPRGAPPESAPPVPGGLPPDRAAATGAGHAGPFGGLRPALFRAAACLVVAVAAFLALPGGASAQENPVSPSWSLTPSGLSDGDRFRLIFVTSTTRNARSSNIGVYNTFVQDHAAAGHLAIRPYSSQFRVVGSTAAVDARDNTSTTGRGVRIYWLNGTKVADHNSDFYNGNWDDEANPKDESGSAISPSDLIVFTGSKDNGTEDFDGSSNSRALGQGSVAYGIPNHSLTQITPLSGLFRASTTTGNFYALSPVFTVTSAPAITDVSVTSRPADGTDTFKHGERVEITFTFNQAVEVRNKGTGGGNVYINVSVGNEGHFNQQTNYFRQDHPRKLVFAFTVTVSHVDGNGFCIGSACGNDNIKLQNTGAIVATADDVAARRGYGAVQTSWNLAGGRDGLTGGVCDRHPAVRDAIVAKISATDTCDEVTDAQVNAIGSLDLSGESIGSLHKRDFEGLTALHTLDLSDNALDHLPGDLFEPLDDTLRTLKLNRNPLGALPAGLFDGLTGIRTLDLADTGLAELPAGLFADLDRLETLRLVENRLRAFPAAALADVAGTLEELFMRDNDIASIAAGDLDGFGELQRLALSDNALASLPAGLFDDATELYELKLDNNALASLPDDLLRPLTKLRTVWLGGNPGFDGFAPAVEAIPAQSVERRARVELEAETGTSPWGDNVTWSWTQTDSSGTTVTLNDADTATPWFDAPRVDDETVFAFEATATGRGTSGGGASEGAATVQVTVPGQPSIVDVSVTSRPADGSNTFKRGDRIEVTVTFSEPVQFLKRNSALGAAINLIFDVTPERAGFDRQDHPNKLIFARDVFDGESDTGGFWIGALDTVALTSTISVFGGSLLIAVSDDTNARRIFDVKQTTWRVNGNRDAPTGGVCDRQHKVRDAIVAAVSAADTCADVTDTHLAGIASLDLSGKGIDSLRKRDFEGLAGLTELNLSGNALDYLPGNLFDHVATLTGLKLNANAALAALPASLFGRLAALEELELRANALTALPRRVFDRLTALRGLDLRRNGLTALSAVVFDDLTELRRLKLAQNALTSLPDGVFGALAKLEDGGLSLGDNPGSAGFVPQIAVGAPAQTVRPGVRVDLEATAEPNPWDANLLWSWARTDTGAETVTLEDDDTRTAHFVAPPPAAVEIELAFEVTATGRGTAGVANPRQATADAAVTVEDTVPPELARARVSSSGDQLFLHFNEDLDIGAGDFPADAFTVKADGVEVAASEVLRSADGFNVLFLQLPAAAIGQHQVVTVSYAVPATGPVIADVAGNEALPFIDEPVTNASTVANTTPPVLTRARVSSSGDQLYLDFNEDLDVGAGDPPADAFTVKADGVEVAASEVLRSADGFNVLFLQLPTAAIKQDQTVTVSYAVPESGPVIADTDGNEAKAFDDYAVTNNSTVDATPPELERASVFASGDQLLLYFNEDLDIGPGELPPADAFTVKADGVEVAVSEVFQSTSGFHVLILNLPAGAIGRGHTVTVSYAVPTTGTVIADVAGNEALAFTDERVTNNSTVFVMDATGKPTISGVPQVGNTLRADISGIEDDDGLPATLTYRWVRVVAAGLETAVGTDSSYTVSSADVGSTIRVDVSFTDGAGNPEGPLPSDAVPAVAAAGTCPAGSDWRATLTMGYQSIETGSTRTQHFGFRSDIGALVPATIPYGTGYPVTLLTRTLTTTRDGNTTYTDSVSFGVSGANLPGGDLPDGTVLNLGATALTVGTDSHSGTAGREQWDLQTLGISPTWVDGQELTVCANLAPVLESARADGTSLVLTYAEALDAGSTPAPGAYAVTVDGTAAAPSSVSVSGRTVTLTLAAAVTGGEAVTLTYTPGSNPVQDVSGLDAPGFGDETVVVNNGATGAPTISGVAQVGGMLTADVSAIRDADGLPSGFDYRWVRIASGGGKTDIGTNMSRYSPTYADVGSTIGVEVSFTDGKGYPEGPLASADTAAVTAPTTTGTCPADSDWRATLTIGYLFETLTDVLVQRFGYDVDTTDFGALDLVTIPYAPDYTVTKITRNLLTLLDGNTIDQDSLNFTVTGGDLPDGTVLNFGATVLTVDTDSATLTAGQEHWSLLALGLSPTWVGGEDYTVCANLPPGLESATVEGTSLVLTYTEDLDASSVPLPGAYSVTVDGTAAAPSSVSVSGNTVTLTLAEAVTAGRSATVTYTPGSNPVQDGSGLDALPLTGEEVDIRDETPPEPASAAVPTQGDRLTLSFNEDLDIGPARVPPPGAFTVKADGVPVTVQSVVGASLDTLLLTLSSTIKQGRTVTVDYTVPGDDDNPLQDVGGNKTGNFTFAVDNKSTVEGTPPEPASGTVPAEGNELTLTFTEDLDIAAVPPASAFTVKADGVEWRCNPWRPPFLTRWL